MILVAKLMKVIILEERTDVTQVVNVRVKEHAPMLAGAQEIAAALQAQILLRNPLNQHI
jgi:hypothetical protein